MTAALDPMINVQLAAAMIRAARRGAPETIGYDAAARIAFKHGHDTAMTHVYTAIMGAFGERVVAEACALIRREDDRAGQ